MVACGEYRYNMDDMRIMAKKDLGEGMVEYTISTGGPRNDVLHFNLSSRDNSFQVYDRLKISNKDN
jgi:hypothetical protein